MARGFVGIIDCNVGNHQSVLNALHFLGVRTLVSSKPSELEKADALILPGVGAFGEMVRGLEKDDLIPFIKKEVAAKKPLLGICLGMQVLAEGSEEDTAYKGLGLIPGHIDRLKSTEDLRVPHVGWNDCSFVKSDSPIFQRYEKNQTFYFDHSFHYAGDAKYISSRVSYGGEVVASIEHGALFGVQFHPEKSQLTGLRLLRSFTEFSGVR